jgi:hypothetical protein
MKKLLLTILITLIFNGSAHSIIDMKIKCKLETNTMSPKQKYTRLFVIENNRLKYFGSMLNGKPLLFSKDIPIRVQEVGYQLIIEGLTEKGTIGTFQIYLNTVSVPRSGYFNSTFYYGKYDYPFLKEGITSIDDWRSYNNFTLEFFYKWSENYKLQKKEYLKAKGEKFYFLESNFSPFKDINYTSGKCKVVKNF